MKDNNCLLKIKTFIENKPYFKFSSYSPNYIFITLVGATLGAMVAIKTGPERFWHLTLALIIGAGVLSYYERKHENESKERIKIEDKWRIGIEQKLDSLINKITKPQELGKTTSK